MRAAVQLDPPLHDSDFYLGDPYPTFARLRAEAPVHWCEAGGFWALSKHDDVLAVSKDPLTFCSSKGILIDDRKRHVTGVESVIYLDPPEHNRHRKLVSGWFHPRTVKSFADVVVDRARQVLDAVPSGEVVDVNELIAVPLPIIVIAEMLGVPAQHQRQFREWSDLIISAGGDEMNAATMGAMAELYDYFRVIVEERRARPSHDLVSTLVEAEIDGERLSEAEILGFCMTLLVAGNETTRNLISNGMLALAEHSDEWRALRDDPSIATPAVEELLRWTTPVMHFARTVTRTTEIRGQALDEGDYVVMLYGSANRDEDVFGDTADRLDLRRDPNPHLAFGFAEHFCLGAGLARLEARVLLEELARRYTSLELAGEVERRRSNLMRGMHHLPMVLTP